MIVKEHEVERFAFSCANCDHVWSLDFDVEHVEDGHGHAHDYFFSHGLPIVDPTAPSSMLCPACHTTHIYARLAGRQAAATPIHTRAVTEAERETRR